MQGFDLLVNWPNFRFISCKIAKIIVPLSCQIFGLYAGGHKLAPQHATFVKFPDFVEPRFRYFTRYMYHSQTWPFEKTMEGSVIL